MHGVLNTIPTHSEKSILKIPTGLFVWFALPRMHNNSSQTSIMALIEYAFVHLSSCGSLPPYTTLIPSSNKQGMLSKLGSDIKGTLLRITRL